MTQANLYLTATLLVRSYLNSPHRHPRGETQDANPTGNSTIPIGAINNNAILNPTDHRTVHRYHQLFQDQRCHEGQERASGSLAFLQWITALIGLLATEGDQTTNQQTKRGSRRESKSSCHYSPLLPRG